MHLIGIAGKKRSGKDTVGKMIQELRPKMQLIAFADKLKEFCSIAYGIPLEMFYDDKWKEVPVPTCCGGSMSPRAAMTRGGHDALVGVTDIHLWSDIVKAEWISISTHRFHRDGGMIITDVRFEWEAEWIVQAGGTILTVLREATDGEAGSHASEKGLPDMYLNHSIQNNGDLDGLQKMVKMFVQHLNEWKSDND